MLRYQDVCFLFVKNRAIDFDAALENVNVYISTSLPTYLHLRLHEAKTQRLNLFHNSPIQSSSV